MRDADVSWSGPTMTAATPEPSASSPSRRSSSRDRLRAPSSHPCRGVPMRLPCVLRTGMAYFLREVLCDCSGGRHSVERHRSEEKPRAHTERTSWAFATTRCAEPRRATSSSAAAVSSAPSRSLRGARLNGARFSVKVTHKCLRPSGRRPCMPRAKLRKQPK